MTDRGTTGRCPTCGSDKKQAASLSAPSAPQLEPVRELVEALKECYVDLGGLLQATTWELAPAVRAQLQKTHDLTGRVLARYQK